MTDPNTATQNTASQTTTGTAQSQPGGNATQPNGTVQPTYTPDQVESWKRDAERARGMQGFYDKASKLGFRKPEDFDRYEPVFKTISTQKIDPAKFAAAFEQQHEDGDTPRESLAKMKELVREELGREMTEREKQWTIKAAQAEYEKSFNDDLGNFTPEKIKEILGDDYDDNLGEVARYAAVGRYLTDPKLNKPYPEGHPLAGRFMPAGADGVGEITKSLKEFVTKQRATSVLKLGKAAAKTPSSTAGPGGQGKASVTEGKDDPREAIISKHVKGKFQPS